MPTPGNRGKVKPGGYNPRGKIRCKTTLSSSLLYGACQAVNRGWQKYYAVRDLGAIDDATRAKAELEFVRKFNAREDELAREASEQNNA